MESPSRLENWKQQSYIGLPSLTASRIDSLLKDQVEIRCRLRANRTNSALFLKLKTFMMWYLWNMTVFANLEECQRFPSSAGLRQATEVLPAAWESGLLELPGAGFTVSPVFGTEFWNSYVGSALKHFRNCLQQFRRSGVLQHVGHRT